jgi:hypothetical protein
MLIRDSPILCIIHHAAFALYKISFITHYNFMLQLHKYRTYVSSHRLYVIVVWLIRYVSPINTQTFIVIAYQKRWRTSVCLA